MGWVESWQQHLRWTNIVRGVGIGGLLAAAGGWSLYSETLHQLTGKPSTATLIEHIRECTIDYPILSEKGRRKEPMACDAAEAFQKSAGPNKIKVSAERFALIRFPLADGRMHEAKVYETNLHSHGLPVGAQIAVVYSPNKPSEVRAELTWDHFKVSLTLFAVGVVVLMLTFAGSIAGLFARAFRRGSSPVDNLPLPAAVLSGRAASPTIASEPRAGFGRRK
ncbi:MAG TPA: DUF3592 domain-containing protein [Gemmataceae bacterium]|nr:DUF3592 domain-containing protein [Gemmataceae bacterium]